MQEQCNICGDYITHASICDTCRNIEHPEDIAAIHAENSQLRAENERLRKQIAEIAAQERETCAAVTETDGIRAKIAQILETIAHDGLPGPRDLDVALDAITCTFRDAIRNGDGET